MLKGVKKTSRGYMAFCPAHDDGNSHGYKDGQSLEVWEKDGLPKLKCYAGCPTNSILNALKISQDDITHGARKARKKDREIVATYDYHDAGGQLLFQVCRFKPKGFSQRRPDSQGGWIWDLKGITPVPYRLPEITAAVAAGKNEKEVKQAVDKGLTEAKIAYYENEILGNDKLTKSERLAW